MKRNLIAVAAIGLALGTNVALADNSWAFDDAYWKQGQSAPSVQATVSAEARDKYDQVDRYNP